jgi:hypothetical protein
MDGSGASAEPDGAAPPPPAFYGFWPQITETQPAATPRLVEVNPAGTASNRGATEGSVRLA